VPNAGDPKDMGEINVEITCGGVVMRPRDWIVGDDKDVMVVPRGEFHDLARDEHTTHYFQSTFYQPLSMIVSASNLFS